MDRQRNNKHVPLCIGWAKAGPLALHDGLWEEGTGKLSSNETPIKIRKISINNEKNKVFNVKKL